MTAACAHCSPICGLAWRDRPHHARAAVDVRGGGPGTRETDALASENLVGRAHAVVLAGGSVFGLAAADGVAAWLSSCGLGLQWRSGSPAIPIVPCAVLHDLGNGGDKNWGLSPPYRDLGLQACGAAATDFALGSVGAGRGAMAGLRKGGIGSASVDLHGGLIVGALVALNSVGSALMPDGKTYWAWAFELGDEFGGCGPPISAMDLSDPPPDESRLLAIGRLTPGTHIPIVNEQEERTPPDYYLVLAWNFLDFFRKKYEGYLEQGGQFIVPHPEVHCVSIE